jgi:excisionase family DNA binding protein
VWSADATASPPATVDASTNRTPNNSLGSRQNRESNRAASPEFAAASPRMRMVVCSVQTQCASTPVHSPSLTNARSSHEHAKLGRMPNGGPRFLKLTDVADVLNVTTRQVYALVRSGDLRGIQVGGRNQWRIEDVELEGYIQRQYQRGHDHAAEGEADRVKRQS